LIRRAHLFLCCDTLGGRPSFSRPPLTKNAKLGAISEAAAQSPRRTAVRLIIPVPGAGLQSARARARVRRRCGWQPWSVIPRSRAQQIYAISGEPRYPGSLGHAQPVTIKDGSLLADWLTAFHQEAVPHDPLPSREELQQTAGEHRFLFWIVNGRPVSMAGIVRRLRTSAAITGVYTPPELRGHGYGGSVTAATVERIYAQGRTIACLYADLRNPASNRCYTKIGFTPVCRSLHFHRTSTA
jgi:GNAT superfamily N-acetyltransferase